MLGSGGRYLLVSFDRLELNPVPKPAEDAVVALFPEDPPEYMERGPFSYADPALIEHDLLAAGFADIEFETVALSSRVSARDAAQGVVLGSLFRSEIERRDPSALDRAVNAVTPIRSASGAAPDSRSYSAIATQSPIEIGPPSRCPRGSPPR